jgi:hypothetical protein
MVSFLVSVPFAFAAPFADFERDYWRETDAERRRILMPFQWSEVAERGQIHGDRGQGSRVGLANPLHFSYPGYSEILTGIVDPRIANNDKLPNPNRTVLEWLNELQVEIPSPWDTVRLDAFTHRFALAWLAARRPRMLFVALGETDDFAHDGWYDLYARAATRSDTFIGELSAWVQADPEYRDSTTFIITTDHGRGRTLADWRNHGPATEANPAGFPGDDEIWLAVLGPDTPWLGAVRDGPELVAASVPATPTSWASTSSTRSPSPSTASTSRLELK